MGASPARLAPGQAHDRHQDLRYLIFPVDAGEEILDGALEVYEPALGLRPDRDRIRLGNGACAIGFLAFRYGTPPESRSYGRKTAFAMPFQEHSKDVIGRAFASLEVCREPHFGPSSSCRARLMSRRQATTRTICRGLAFLYTMA